MNPSQDSQVHTFFATNNASCEQECALYDKANENACNIAPYIQFVFLKQKS